jgi:hypothetical protein
MITQLTCNICPHLEVRQTYMESLYSCSKKGKRIEYSGTKMVPPEWCPLKKLKEYPSWWTAVHPGSNRKEK